MPLSLPSFSSASVRFRAWVLVTASKAEGWGLTTLEAAACGTPTVALGVGGLAEAVEDERTGLLAPDAAPGALAFRYYDKDKKVRGKRMEDHLRMAVCYWHTFVWNGFDVFGAGTFGRTWHREGADAQRR